MNSMIDANLTSVDPEFFNATPQRNSTDYSISNKTVFISVIDHLVLVALIIIMLSMGCKITWEQVLEHVKKPIGISIGMFSQFVIMPLSAYLLLMMTNISGLHATGILIISSCPGGILSNAFTYFCDGDISLSVAMTSVSTLLAMGIMPLNVWLYSNSIGTTDLVIPHKSMTLSLVLVTSPVIIGMLLRWKVQKVAHHVEKVGSRLGPFLVLMCTVFEVAFYPSMFHGVSGKLYGVMLTLPLIGLTLGFLLSSVLGQTMAVRRTIAIESGIQNVPVALSIVTLSFPVEMQDDVSVSPWLYGFAMMIECSILCIAYNIYTKLSQRKGRKITITASKDEETRE